MLWLRMMMSFRLFVAVAAAVVGIGDVAVGGFVKG